MVLWLGLFVLLDLIYRRSSSSCLRCSSTETSGLEAAPQEHARLSYRHRPRIPMYRRSLMSIPAATPVGSGRESIYPAASRELQCSAVTEGLHLDAEAVWFGQAAGLHACRSRKALRSAALLILPSQFAVLPGPAGPYTGVTARQLWLLRG